MHLVNQIYIYIMHCVRRKVTNAFLNGAYKFKLTSLSLACSSSSSSTLSEETYSGTWIAYSVYNTVAPPTLSGAEVT